MESLQARIDSFAKTRRVRRNPSKPSSASASLKWPHPPHFKANPNTLAEAGFFFDPSWDDRDSVACFFCAKELSDWDEHDDPFDIHYAKCASSCAWAVVRCGLAEDLDDDGRFVFANKSRLPSNKDMEKARLETFGTDWWPHDDDPGHGATSVKMAQAGFVYTPQAAGDDTVTCLYCNLSLGGWEKEDNPIHEHRLRDRKARTACPFLALSSKQTRSKAAQQAKKAVDKEQSDDELAVVEPTEPPPPRAKRGKARSTTSSKSRRKTRATRGKSTKASAPPSHRSPSPSQTTPDEAPVHDTPMDVDVPPLAAPEPEPVSEPPPLSARSHPDDSPVQTNGSMPDRSNTPPAPNPPSKPDTPPPDVPMRQPDPIISLSPAGQPTITHSKALTHDERAMSLEQWIRHEINVSHDKLLNDGRQQIELFKTRAAELRRRIDEL